MDRLARCLVFTRAGSVTDTETENIVLKITETEVGFRETGQNTGDNLIAAFFG